MDRSTGKLPSDQDLSTLTKQTEGQTTQEEEKEEKKSPCQNSNEKVKEEPEIKKIEKEVK